MDKDTSVLTSELRSLAFSEKTSVSHKTAVLSENSLGPVSSEIGVALEQRLYALEVLLGSSANMIDLSGDVCPDLMLNNIYDGIHTILYICILTIFRFAIQLQCQY